jgi:SAM-dependent methyltransferase
LIDMAFRTRSVELESIKENPSATDWAAARGEKWLARLTGMEAMLAPIDEPLIRALSLDAPCSIADIGCGGGGTTLEIMRRAPAGSVVHGFDVSPALIEWARRNRKRSDESSIAFEIADMATAPAPPEPYDRLASRFGIMFFDDPPAAFANLARWLAPGGRFAFAVWGRPAENPWFTSVRQVVAERVNLPPPDPEARGQFRYAEADKLLTLLDRAGFGTLDVSDGAACSRSAVGCQPRRRRISPSPPLLHSARCLPKQATGCSMKRADH